MTLILENKNLTIKASVILALVIIAAYSPVIFLNQSYSQVDILRTNSLQKKDAAFLTTIDPAADFEAIFPVHYLASEMYKKGQLPLWDPYVGTGQPLAADTDNYVFSPLFLVYLLPSSVWDLGLLAALWTAGIFTYLFLKNIGLRFLGALCGGIFYMLSGAFTWYLPHTSTAVIMFTPLLLYSLDRLVRKSDLRSFVISSLAFGASFLGAHIETIILQSVLVALYLCYRIFFVRNRFKKNETISGMIFSAKRNVSSVVLSFACGLGLVAFFLLPVFEFLKQSSLGHDNLTGGTYLEPYSVVTTFVPYVMGTVQFYWNQTMAQQGNWNTLWGYVGVFALFFSIIGLYCSWKDKDNPHRYTPLFFLAVSVFFIMKAIGVPLVNSIGSLPILQYVTFPRYSMAIIPIGFAISAGFGIDYLARKSLDTKKIVLVGAISAGIILALMIPLLPYLSSHQQFTVSRGDVVKYVGFQIAQALLFVAIITISSIAIAKRKVTSVILVPLITLELFLYMPVGLYPVWMAFKALVVLIGMAAIILVTIRPNRFSWNLKLEKPKSSVIAGLFIIAIIGGVAVSAESHFGMAARHNLFGKHDITEFIKNNSNYSRIFSLEFYMSPNFPAAYQIKTLGVLSAFSINSFYSFTYNFIDSQAWATNLGVPSWTRAYGPILAEDKISEEKKYFDFLGVKYFLSQNYDLTTTMIGPNQTVTDKSVNVGPDNNSTGQSFFSPTDSISSIGLTLRARILHPEGSLQMTIDSVPYDSKLHRESVLNSTDIVSKNFANFVQLKLQPPLSEIAGKQLYLRLSYPQSSETNKVEIYYFDKTNPGFDFVKEKLNGQLYQEGNPVDGKEMEFVIIPTASNSTTMDGLEITENKDAYPNTFLVSKFQVAPEGAAQDLLKNNTGFDLRNNVLLEDISQSDITSLQGSKIDLNSKAEVVSYQPSKVSIQTENSAPAILVLTDTYYPGWKAFVDGHETKIYRADGLVRAIIVPAGNHDVSFSYMPKSFAYGSYISLITAGILVGLVVFTYRRKNQVGNVSHIGTEQAM